MNAPPPPLPRLRPGDRVRFRNARWGEDASLEYEVRDVLPPEGETRLARIALPSAPEAPGRWQLTQHLVPVEPEP
ncbi:hypothetical protein [Paludisphaera rhizosphaerae]|uniref:hypothetical protein n=1 Tax=Paludisphaera rhizosphaerae TaxID=2711216 RepID=UPI0013EA1246|nr:hypothetical protein [Paludisphaera rhizosphaerae]